MTIWTYLERRWSVVLTFALEHVWLVVFSIAIGTLIGVVLGTLVYRSRYGTSAALIVTSSAFTVPALAYFGVLVFVVGLGFGSSAIVLIIYALLPITRNTITGLQEVPAAVVKSATGMGMGALGRLLRIELPLAWPVILAGIRVAAVMTVGIAAIAPWIGGPGLGRLIFGGLSGFGTTRGTIEGILGTVGVIVVALVLDGFLLAVGKFTTPAGLRAGGGR